MLEDGEPRDDACAIVSVARAPPHVVTACHPDPSRTHRPPPDHLSRVDIDDDTGFVHVHTLDDIFDEGACPVLFRVLPKPGPVAKIVATVAVAGEDEDTTFILGGLVLAVTGRTARVFLINSARDVALERVLSADEISRARDLAAG